MKLLRPREKKSIVVLPRLPRGVTIDFFSLDATDVLFWCEFNRSRGVYSIIS